MNLVTLLLPRPDLHEDGIIMIGIKACADIFV
jgi:hypothetical protein